MVSLGKMECEKLEIMTLFFFWGGGYLTGFVKIIIICVFQCISVYMCIINCIIPSHTDNLNQTIN